MNLQQLDHLIALAETRSFSRAAERVFLTQPALSRSIQTLEEELGVPLVDRIGKRNELTPFGADTVARARRIALEATELKRAAQLLKQGGMGNVSLGMGSAARAVLAGPLLEHLLLQQPGIRLRLTGGSPAVQLAALRARVVDALLVTYHILPEFDGLDIALLDPLMSGFLCRAGHPLADRAAVSFEELRQHHVLSTVISPEVTRRLMERYGPAADPQAWLQGTAEDIGTLVHAVLRTDAVFWGVLAVARSWMAAGELVELRVRPDPDIRSRFAFVTLAGRTAAPALETIRRFCVEHIAQEADPGRGTAARPARR